MKKIFAVLISAVMMAAGLVVASGSTAQAACPYSGCVNTYTYVNAPSAVKRHNKALIRARVKAATGNASPKGRVTIRVVRNNGGYRYTESKRYTGGLVKFRTSKLHKRGKYTVFAWFDKRPGSRWLDSDNTDSFRVVRR